MKVTEFIVCEDIRQEADGRCSLMGVIPGELVVRSDPERKTPIPVRLAVHVAVDIEDGPAPRTFEFSIRRQDERLVSATGVVQAGEPDQKRLQFAAGGDRLRLRGPGPVEITLVLRDSDGKEQLRDGRTIVVSLENATLEGTARPTPSARVSSGSA